MSPTVLDAAAVQRALPDPVAVRRALMRAFSSLGSGRAAQPPQAVTLLPGDLGDMITYTGTVVDGAGPGLVGVKLSPYLSHRAPGRRVTAWTLLLSTEDGTPLLLCDSLALTTERTAGTSALAIDLLTPSTATILSVIGSGPVAVAHLRHLRDVRRWDEIRVFSPSLATDGDRAHAMFGPDVVVSPDAEAAVRDADVTACCTSAAATVVDAAWLASSAVVSSVSTNAPLAREIDPAQLHLYAVTCDERTNTPNVAGEMVLAARDHGWSPDSVVADLADLVSGTTVPSGMPILFRSVGLGIEDIAIASLLLEAS